ncbi:MAG: tetratricopeptide repeat protein [Paludibacteraceae bacterium]|nr:tetratricopeptide repeat protein [Paludibacteraceae bacterium]
MKTKLFTILLSLFPLFLIAQNYEKEGDDLFAQGKYEQAVKKYNALQAAVGSSSSLTQKIDKCRKCNSLLSQAQTTAQAADNAERFDNAADLYDELYKIHPLQTYMIKASQYRQKANDIRQEEREWEDARYANTLDAYQDFIDKHPNSIHREEAQQRKDDIERQIRQNEEDAWKYAVRNNSISSYQRFAQNYPNGKYTKQARQKIEELKEKERIEQLKRQEETDWSRATQTNTVDAYQNFIDKYPDSNYAGRAKQKISDITDEKNWNAACLENTISAYQRYIENDGKNKSIAYSKMDVIKRQKELIMEASDTKDDRIAYEKIQEARRLGELSKENEKTALQIEEPYAYKLAKRSDAYYSTMSDYMQKYIIIAPENHIKTISKKKSKAQTSTSTISTHSYTAKDNYYDNNGKIQYTWIAAEGYFGTALGGTASIFEWRFWLVEIAPLTLGYHYIPDYSADWSSNILKHRFEGLYIQPTVRCYFPFNTGNQAVFIGAAPTMPFEDLVDNVFEKPIKTWFMAEAGYNYNSGILNGNLFLRYNGDIVVGLQLKICHVLGKK